MMCINCGEHVVASVCGGTIMAVLTGLFATGSMLLGEIRHGYALLRLILQVAFLQLLQWKVRPLNLLVDVLVWSVVSGIVVLAAFSGHIAKSWRGFC